jgi:hypothetical protein
VKPGNGDCDGSVFSGDDDVVDASFPFGPVRFHRGLLNLSAAMDVATQEQYRAILVPEHELIHDANPFRYKRLIRNGDDEHTALQLPTLYLGEANGTPLYEWTENFVPLS